MTAYGQDRGGPTITVSVVTHNSEACLPVLLDSLRRQTDIAWEAHFFDNASSDRTVAILRESGLGEVFVNDTNIGYGRAHNRNLSRTGGAHLILLNPDLQFDAGLFAQLSHYLQQHPKCGLAGPHILEGPDSQPFPPRYFYPGEGMIALEPGLRRHQIAWISGCCFIIRRDVFKALQGFDPDYFLYSEDTDLCFRARRAGHQIGYAHGTIVRHLHRQSQRELSEYGYACRVFQGSAIFWEKRYPHSVLHMVRFQYWACVLLLWLAKKRVWRPHGYGAFNKARLRARRSVCAEWLEAHRRRRFALGLTTVRIGARQCRIALEWTLRRQFPLDDY